MNKSIPAVTRLINPTTAIVPSVAPRFCPIIDDGDVGGIRFEVKFNLAKGNLTLSNSSINQTASRIIPANTTLRTTVTTVRLFSMLIFFQILCEEPPNYIYEKGERTLHFRFMLAVVFYKR
jgi:hypothetical protein